MSQYDFDLFIIGGGSGGVRASRVSAALGARVAIAGRSSMVSEVTASAKCPVSAGTTSSDSANPRPTKANSPPAASSSATSSAARDDSPLPAGSSE